MDTTEAAVRGDGRVILDMTVSATHVASIGAMNGHEGDDGRIIEFVLYGQGNRPVNLQGYTVDLIGTDAAGKLKVGGHYQPVDPAVGTFDFTMPGAFYQQKGDYSRAYFRIKDGNNQVVSTINVMFTVVAGVGFLTSGDSQIYNGHVEDLMQQTETTVKNYTDTIQKMVEGNQGEVTAMRSLITNMIAEIKDNQVAALGADNSFTGTNKFSGVTEIDKLQGAALQTIYDKVNTLVSNAIAGIKFPSQCKVSAWQRNCTFERGDIKGLENDTGFGTQEITLPTGNRIITGSGNINLHVGDGAGNNVLRIHFPYDIEQGSSVVGVSYNDFVPVAFHMLERSVVDVTYERNSVNNYPCWLGIHIITPVG